MYGLVMVAPEPGRPPSEPIQRSNAGTGSIAINGDLGSGKSTVAAKLAEKLGLRNISVGSLYRELALTRGMTTLELNRHARRDPQIDDYIDSMQKDMLRDGERAIIDSRLGWHFLPGTFKVHLVSDPHVAAARVMTRLSADETYSSLPETLELLRERADNERSRFMTKYGVNKSAMRNYDLVCDTSYVSADQAADAIAMMFQEIYGSPSVARPTLLLNPSRVYPTRSLADLSAADRPRSRGLICGYADGAFYALRGHEMLSSALSAEAPFVRASLAAEGDEPISDHLSARSYFRRETTLVRLHDWETSHGLSLALPAHLSAGVVD